MRFETHRMELSEFFGMGSHKLSLFARCRLLLFGKLIMEKDTETSSADSDLSFVIFSDADSDSDRDSDTNWDSDTDAKILIPGKLPTSCDVRIPPAVRRGFTDYFFEFHRDVFHPEDKNYPDEENALLWQGLAVYHTIAVTNNSYRHIYNNFKGQSEGVRKFSNEMCHWAMSHIRKNIRELMDLSLIQKYYLWADLFALNEVLCDGEQEVWEKLTSPEKFSRLKSFLEFHVNMVDEDICHDIGESPGGLQDEIPPYAHWTVYLYRRLEQICEFLDTCSVDGSEEEPEGTNLEP
jgi:hypothetical protein